MQLQTKDTLVNSTVRDNFKLHKRYRNKIN